MDTVPAAVPEGAGTIQAKPARGAATRPRVKILLLCLVVVGLLGIVLFAASREVSTPPANARAARPVLPPPRPPLTAAEEEYALALWPIHNEVKTSALKMTLGGLSYKLGDLDRAGLKTKVEGSAEKYGKAGLRITALTQPPSLSPAHEMS